MGGRLFEAGRLLTFSAFRMGAYSWWALIRGWALIQINTVLTLISVSVLVKDTTESLILHFFFTKIVSAVIYTERG